MKRPITATLSLAVITGSLAACSGSSGGGSTVTVDAAASLMPVFTALGRQFELRHPRTTVRFNFGGSDQLAAQIVAGAPVDVFAAASTATMATVTSHGDAAATPVVFVRNEPEIAVPPANPAHISGLADTTKPGVTLVLCAPTVPCGAAADKAYAAASLTPHPKSLESEVTSVLTKVELDQADAGIVYVTDVKAAGAKVRGITFPEAASAVTSYPIVVTKHGATNAMAKQFQDFVLSPTGRRALQAAGFLSP